MKQLTADQLEENWKKLIQIIKDTFEDGSERREKLLKMYHHFQDRMMMAPASGTEHFHNCHPGGYVEHILNVIELSVQLFELWEKNGANINYTKEELIFAAIHHDLGKVGDLDNDNYTPNPSEWHRKNQGKIYVANPDIHYQTPPDRGLWILNQFGIKYSIIEMLGIQLADGMYDEGNVKYLKTFNKDICLKTNLPYIIHQADQTATRIEYESWLSNDDTGSVTNNIPKSKDEQKKIDSMKKKFDELFPG